MLEGRQGVLSQHRALTPVMSVQALLKRRSCWAWAAAVQAPQKPQKLAQEQLRRAQTQPQQQSYNNQVRLFQSASCGDVALRSNGVEFEKITDSTGIRVSAGTLD